MSYNAMLSARHMSYCVYQKFIYHIVEQYLSLGLFYLILVFILVPVDDQTIRSAHNETDATPIQSR
jgi:hypothetical protein